MEWYTPEMGHEVRRNNNDPHLELAVATGKYPSPLAKKGNEAPQELQLNPSSTVERISISARTVLSFRSCGNSTALGPPLSATRGAHFMPLIAIQDVPLCFCCTLTGFRQDHGANLSRVIPYRWLPSPIPERPFHGVIFGTNRPVETGTILQPVSGETTDFGKLFTAYPEFSGMSYIKAPYTEEQ